MNKPIIVIKVKQTQFKALVSLADSVYEGMHLNPHFVSPQPTLADLNAASVAVKECLAKWGEPGNRGSHLDYVELTAKAFLLHNIVTQLGEWCMSSMDPGMSWIDQRVILNTIGFPLKKTKAPQGVLEQVQGFRRFIARNVAEDCVKLSWKRPLNVTTHTNVKGYVVYRSKTELFSAASVIAVVSKGTYTDKPGAGTWYYWITPMNNKGEGVMSEVVTARIAEGL